MVGVSDMALALLLAGDQIRVWATIDATAIEVWVNEMTTRASAATVDRDVTLIGVPWMEQGSLVNFTI